MQNRFLAPSRRRAVRPAVALGAVALLLAVAVAPASAKELLQARLEAPISFQSPPGSELEVAVLVTVPGETGMDPVDGSPIWLRLFGPKGDVIEAPGRMGTGPGRYVMRIEVPAGGPRRLEVVMRGTGDLPITLVDDPFTFRPIGAGTARLAAPLPIATPFAKPAGPGGPAAQPAVVPPPAAAGDVPPWLAPALAVLVVTAVVLATAVVVRRARGRGDGVRAGAATPGGASAGHGS